MTLFGTDGIRGVAGLYPLDEPTIRKLISAVGCELKAVVPDAPFLVIRDTRASGVWIRDVAVEELVDGGITVEDGGVLPTPAAAYLITRFGFMGGLIISASHNPASDNGLKFLDHQGRKLDVGLEQEIEKKIGIMPKDALDSYSTLPVFQLEKKDISARPDFLKVVVDYLEACAGLDDTVSLGPVVVDCANGAVVPVVEKLMRRAIIDIHPLHHHPNGSNINYKCGATRPEVLAEEVIRRQAVLGLTLDGDGDRVLAVDERGNVQDGDALLYVFAAYLAGQGALARNTVVGTIMTNGGLEAALEERDIRLIRTPVGDKHIQEQILGNGYTLGGEPSGHLILGDYGWTGDGLLAGLILIRIIHASGRPLSSLVEGYRPFPNRLYNLTVTKKPPIEGLEEIDLVERIVKEHSGGKGRIVVRYSGTEPLLRILVEMPDLAPVIPHLEGPVRLLERRLKSY